MTEYRPRRVRPHPVSTAARFTILLLSLIAMAFTYQAVAIWRFGVRAEPARADVIIVLGPRLNGESLDPLGAARADRAAALWRGGYARTILAAGGVVAPGTIPEGEAIRRALVVEGVTPESIVVEPGSRSTMENLLAARTIMSDRGWRTALIVSNCFHLRRAQAFADRVGIPATTAGQDPDGLPGTVRAWWFMREVGASIYYAVW